MKRGTKVWFWEYHYIPGGGRKVAWRNLREGKLIRIDGAYHYIQVCGEPKNIIELYRQEFWTVSEAKVNKIVKLLVANEKE